MEPDGCDDRTRCAEAAAALQCFLDGECGRGEATRVVEHLEACRRCGLEYDTYRRLKKALGGCRNGVEPEMVERLTEWCRRLTAS